MSSTPPSGGRLFVEPLEARIAPAGLTGRANNVAFKPSDPTVIDPSGLNYLDYSTIPVAGARLGFVAASAYGVDAPGVFALAMSGADGSGKIGDQVVIFNQRDGFGPGALFLSANAKNLVAFFQDKNGDGQVQNNELVGLAMGKKSSAAVNGNVDGDIVTNLLNDGTLALGGVNKSSFKVSALSVQNVNGDILSSGDLQNTTVTGTVHDVLAGTAANGVPYHLGGSTGPVTGTIQGLANKDGIVGSSVFNLSVIALTPGGHIQAGDGGLGALGGSINTLRVLGDTDSFVIQGGAGGVGNATIKGGFGGDVTDVRIAGVANSAVNHPITILGGAGGANTEAKGGNGGSVSGLFYGFDTSDLATNSGQGSPDLLTQNLTVHGGNGGNGLRGGNGGSVLSSNLDSAIPDDGVVTAGVQNPELQVFGGDGGANLVAGQGKGGNGGDVSQVIARNLDTLPDALNSSIFVHGGTGGMRKNGGSVDGVTLLGQTLEADGGNGGDGPNKGGAGGSLTAVTVTNLVNLFASSVTLNAGQGGNASGGNGGAGGDITTVRMTDSDLQALTINGGTHANGGTGANGLGGAGGSVTDVILNDTNFRGLLATATVRAGVGADGLTGGGTGGDLAAFTLTGTGFGGTFTAGAGGSILANGAGDGGAGGNLLNVSVSNFPDLGTVPPDSTVLTGQTVTATAGAGGNGTGNGGNGGALQTVNVAAGGSITLVAGNGGYGIDGAAGFGGSSSLGGSNSLAGTVSLTTGNGGVGGSVPGNGGSIDGFVTSAAGAITIHAGNGGVGGMGGSVSNSGTSLNLLTNLPNLGSVDVRSGAGSALGSTVGVGGDITNFHGYVGEGGLTSFTAGNGGGMEGGTKVAAGGNISQVELTGTGGSDFSEATQTVTFDAGNSGVSSTAKKGANGGSVSEVVLYNLDPGTVVHHLAAGDATSGSKKGGSGGSISSVFVGTAGDQVADIGVRSGVRFGYNADQAGGLFAGLGGTGSKTSGVNGSVSNITALAISSIVAGKASHPGLVEAVDKINLEGNTATRANADGSYFNFAVANLVGSVLNPDAAGATTFKFDANGPIDGLIAVRTTPTNLNFVPEAIVEPDPENPGVIALADYQLPNPTPVITPVPATLLA